MIAGGPELVVVVMVGGVGEKSPKGTITTHLSAPHLCENQHKPFHHSCPPAPGGAQQSRGVSCTAGHCPLAAPFACGLLFIHQQGCGGGW